MKHVYDVPEVQRALAQLDDVNNLNPILKHISTLNQRFRDADIYARRLFTPGIDVHVPKLARMLRLGDRDLPRSNDNAVFIVSRMYRTGGHSQVLRDIAERLAPGSFTLVTTGLYAELRYGMTLSAELPASAYGERTVLALQSQTLAERAIELYRILDAIRPSRIFLMTHNMDMVGVMAAWPFRSIVDFVHHADHAPAVGATLPWGAHVDLTYTCHLACREAGLNPLYSGMVAPEPVDRPAPSSAKSGLRIATCGSVHKYRGRRRWGWADYAVAALKQPGVELIHIGPTPPEFEAEIREALTQAGIDPARYEFAGWVESLGRTLVERDVDVYLASFPETGGKSNIEAIMAGVPAIVPVGADVAPLARFRLPFDQFIPIDRPDELPGALAAARELGAAMRAPEAADVRTAERDRFEAYVADRSVPPA